MSTARMAGKKKNTPGEQIFIIALYILFTLFTLVCFYPFYYLIINSISANDVSARGSVLFYPVGIHFRNYAQVFTIRNLGNAALISVLRTVIGTACTVIGSYLGKLFRRKTGMSFHSCLNRIRIEHALEMLASGMRVTDVAEKCGYSGIHSFSRKFRELVGCSPGAYRTQCIKSISDPPASV